MKDVVKYGINPTWLNVRRFSAWKFAVSLLMMLALCVCDASAGGSSNYYASLKINQAGPTGAGSVYVANANTKPGTPNPGTAVKSAATTTSGGNVTMYYWVDVEDGYNVELSGKVDAGPATGNSLNGNVACAASTTKDGTQAYTATATFVAVAVNSVAPTLISLDPTNPSADYSFSATFSTSHMKTIALDMIKSPETADGKFTITSWSVDGTNVVVSGKFNGGGTYGGANRNNSTTLSLQSKAAGSGVKSCNVTANFPALEFVNATATDVFTTTSDATKTGSAEFNFNYGAEDDFPTTPSFTHTSGSGAFTVTGYTVTPDFSAGTCKVEVDYSFNPNNTAGPTVEELTITSVGGLVSSVTVNGTAEAEATDDAKVIAADGTTLIYQGDWATAWTKANTAANAGCTLQVLRNVSGLAANQTVTNTFTLDLNGKTVSGKYNGSLIYINKSAKTLTIKDSKTGGKVENVVNDYAGTAYGVNLTAGNLILESGTIYCENQGASGRKAVGVYQKAGTTFTMNGGKVDVWGYNASYALQQLSNKNNSTPFTMNGGEINILGYQDVYAINAIGKININAGTINATATYSNCRGIYLSASSNAAAASCYYGQLTMKGGTINSTCTAAADGTRYAYGVFFDCANTAMGTTAATDGSHANKAAAVGTIEDAVINVSTLGRYAYGVMAYGSYQSRTNAYNVIKIKNTKIDATADYYYAYGVYATGGVNSTHGAIYFARMELTDCTVNATATKKAYAYAITATSSAATVYQNAQPNYYGEYAGGATVTINSGKYTATTGTTTAYAVTSSTRSKTTFHSDSNVAEECKLGGNAEGYATLIIKDGEFTGNAGTTTARAVSSGGNTTITGGTFKAIAGTTVAYGLYALSGTLTAAGATVEAEANGTAYGVLADCGVATITGFKYFGDVTLKNMTVTATTRTSTTACAVKMIGNRKGLTAATLKSDSTSNKWTAASYLKYAQIYQYGDYAVAAKCSINGGTYTAKAATTTAYGVCMSGPAISTDSDGDGVCAVAYGQLDIKNADINARTLGTTTCYGVWTGGPTTIDKTTINATAQTTTCSGLLIEAGKTTLTNSTINATGTTTVRGIYVNARIVATSSDQTVASEYAGVAGMECIGELEATNNTVTSTATGGNTSYGIYLNAVKGNTASGPFAGDHAIGAIATINSGKYTATATGTTAYGLGMLAQQKQGNLYGRPECHVINGKFYGLADGGTDGSVDANGQMGYVVLSGGYYNKNTNLSKFVEEGKNINDVLSGTTEYTEGYRYTIGSGISGAVVCRVYQGNTERGAYKTLKEALQYVNANQSTALTIVMVANHTLPKGNYVLPSKATLVVPESLTRKSAMGNTPTREAVSTPAPEQFLMLTFANGVNMTVHGTIETTAKQNAANGGSAIAGAPHGPYGRLHLVAGSKITLENGSNFNCWGYTTGGGEITAMSGSKVREGFQLGYWRGGTATSNMLSNKNTWHAFPVTDYFIQNVEVPVMFRPGSDLYGYSAVNVSIVGVQSANDVHLVGSSGAMFLLDPADASEDTYVQKAYDPATDRAVWTVNSGAKLGQFSFSLSGSTVNSADYYLPISNNMTIYINEGEFTVTQDAMLIPGAQIIISKLGKLTVSSGKRLFVMDNEDWPGFKNTSGTTTRWYYNATYSPSWTTNPRTSMYPPTTTPLPDAEIFVHGTTEGQYYTTEHGANIHSTNDDAGVVRFISAAGAATSIQHVVNTNCDLYTINFTSAQLKNEDTTNPYTPTTGTVAGDAYTYMDYMWVNVRENGCLLTRTDGTGTHNLAHPSDVVAVVANSNDQAYHSEDGTRQFVYAEKSVNTAGCVWWEAEKVTTGEHIGDYMANQEQFDNYGAYYYYDSGSGYWKPRYVTVTWKNYDGSALATYTNVLYNTRPHYTSGSPKVPANTSSATYAWTGWKDPNGTFYDKNEPLPLATSNVTYTAHIQETKYEYLITFKNDANKVLHAELFEADTHPVCPSEKITKDQTASQVFEFAYWQDESGNKYYEGDQLPAVTGQAIYTAYFTAKPRKYTVTFVDYDMTFITDTLINYGDLAAYPTEAAEPYRESTDAYSYDWIGWTKALATVTKDVTYIAKYQQTVIKYRVVFKSDCWGQNDGDEGCVEKIHNARDYAFGATVVVPANPARPQTAQYTYTFDHWDPAVVTTVAGAATYTAVYTRSPRSYNIYYRDKNNAVFTGTHGAGAPTTHTYLTSETLVNPTRTGYTFEGWYSDAACTSGNKITTIPADVAAIYTVYANWTPNTYNINYYDQNGVAFSGTHGDNHPTTHTFGTATPLVNPTKTGYTFGGWYLTADCSGTKVTSLIAAGYTADISLYAKWTPNTYNITYRNKDNAPFNGTHAEGYPTQHTFGTATPLDSPTRTGYTFSGWFTSMDCTTGQVSTLGATDYTAAITLYALWTPNTYNINYYDQNGVAFSGTHGDNYPTTHTFGTATPLVNPTREGYTFAGWYLASDCSGTKLTTLAATTYTADISLYAKWTVHTHKLVWNLDGGSTSSTTHTAAGNAIPYGTEIVYPADNTMSKTGYTFSGWSTSVTTMPDEDLTIIAQWTINKYTITFVDGDGNTLTNTAAADNQWEYGSTPSYTGTTPTKTMTDEYTFTFNNTWSPAIVSVTGDATYTAQFDATSRQMGEVLDVVDWTDTYVLLNMNGYSSPASKADWKVVYNGTTYTKANRDNTSVNAGDRTMKIAVSGLEADQKIVITATDKNNNLESYHTYTVPHIYNANATLSGTTEESVVFVHRGATLTVAADAAAKEIYVAAGAELRINSGVTLTVNKLVLRTEAFSSSVLTDNGTLNCSNLFYSRIVAEKDAAYQIGFPFNIDLTKTKFSNGKTATHGTHYALMDYDAQARAENGIGGNWNILTGNTMSKNHGYTLISTSAYYYEILFPVTASAYAARPTDNAEVSITNYTGQAKSYDQGWNFITQPYTNVYSTELSNEPEDVIQVAILARDNETYYQMPLENMAPAYPFYYQARDGEQALVFKNGSLSRRSQNTENTIPTQWIRLWYAGIADFEKGLDYETSDQTNIYVHPTKYTAEYERGYDVVKMSKTASIPRIYSSLECGDLAFAAIPDHMATQAIPLTVYNPTNGTMNFRLDDNNCMQRLEHVYLIDMLTGEQTDLMHNDYQYEANTGTLTGRFIIRTVINEEQPTVHTDVEQTTEQKWTAHAGNRSIIVEGIRNKDINCYNSIGQLIKVVKANDATRTEFRVGVDGVYILRSADKVEKIVVK